MSTATEGSINDVQIEIANRDILHDAWHRLYLLGFTVSIVVPPSRKNWHLSMHKNEATRELALIATRVFDGQYQMNVRRPVTKQQVAEEYALTDTEAWFAMKHGILG
jgi:hypothetical protein